MSILGYSLLGLAGGLLFIILTAALFSLLVQIRDLLVSIYALLKDKN